MAQSTELGTPAAKSQRVTSKQAEKQAKKYRAKAEKYKDDPKATEKLLKDVQDKAHKGPLASHLHNITTLIRMVRAYVKGEYREVPWESIAIAIGALIYFLSPIDLIPDVIPVAGYADDAAVIALVVASLSTDLLKFRDWEASQLAA
jgi:uncharacterized membrane protein YkvA (DUF1232 family)